ncbi:MAG TPA: hypothetical protein GX497_10585 [Bacillus bacterium]|nr:hypothetical protein [Bacillus sp. (in: firmicutes)]
MNCNEVQSKWNVYINGECSAEEELEVEEHLQTCSKCEQLLNEELENQQKAELKNDKEGKMSSGEDLSEIPIKKQKQLIRRAKWKNRLMNALTVFGLLIIVSIISTMVTGAYYFWGGDNSRGEKARQVIRTATQMTMPNVYISGTGLESNIFFTMDMKAEIEKELGNESKAIGQLRGKMLFNLLNVTREWVGGQYNVKLYFLHPHSGKQYNQEIVKDTWHTLDILPQGTVSEMALTFDNVYEIDKVYDILKDYDLAIVWYAIETGTEAKNDSPYLGAGSGVWGIHERAIFDFSESGGSIEIRGDGEKRGEAFKKGLRFLAEHKKLAKRYIWGIEENGKIEDMYNYVNKNGVKTYGVVVTGPTKELLRLEENKHIIFATLGEVDFWNWYSRPASGTMY